MLNSIYGMLSSGARAFIAHFNTVATTTDLAEGEGGSFVRASVLRQVL